MKTRNNKSDFDKFYKLPKILFQHSTILNTSTGELIELTLSDIVLYSYMLDQYVSYKESGNDFFESTQSIANKCSHLSERTVKRSLARLKKSGLIEIEKKKGGGQWASNLYNVHSLSELLRDGHITFPETAVTTEIMEVSTPDLQIESVPAPKVIPLSPKTYPWGSQSFHPNGTLRDCVIGWAASQGAVEDEAIIELVREYSPYVNLDDLPYRRKDIDNIDDFEQMPF